MVDPASYIEQASKDHRLGLLFRYWDERRGGRRFPTPTSLDLTDCGYALDQISLVEVQRDPLRFRYRAVAPHAIAQFGHDMTGLTVDEIPEPSVREFVRAGYQRALEKQAPLYESGTALIRLEEWSHETLILPLSSDGESIDLLLIYRDTAPLMAVSCGPKQAEIPADPSSENSSAPAR